MYYYYYYYYHYYYYYYSQDLLTLWVLHNIHELLHGFSNYDFQR